MRNKLDEIMLTPEAARRWIDYTSSQEVLSKIEGLKPHQIPDEDARISQDGKLTIFVALPGDDEISLDFSRDEWAYITKHFNNPYKPHNQA